MCKSEAAPGDTFPISKQLPLSYQLDSLDLKNNKSDVDKSRPQKRVCITTSQAGYSPANSRLSGRKPTPLARSPKGDE